MFGMGGYHIDWDAQYGCVGNPGGYMFGYVGGMYCCGHCGGGGWYACGCGAIGIDCGGGGGGMG